jgi:hypothetical protein
VHVSPGYRKAIFRILDGHLPGEASVLHLTLKLCSRDNNPLHGGNFLMVTTVVLYMKQMRHKTRSQEYAGRREHRDTPFFLFYCRAI